jgi:hypothetical protein
MNIRLSIRSEYYARAIKKINPIYFFYFLTRFRIDKDSFPRPAAAHRKQESGDFKALKNRLWGIDSF